MLPTNDRTSFEYGAFEEIYPYTKFQFVCSLAGFREVHSKRPGRGSLGSNQRT
jgi:hypothetical protein